MTGAHMTEGLSAGFADPVGDAQSCFRTVLDAMAHPGRIGRVAGVAPPASLDAATAAVLLSLVDHETPLWLDPGAATAADWIAFHTGAPRAATAAEAAFVVALALPVLADLNAGGHETPEASTTVILQLASLRTGRRFRLSGPGLREPALFTADGLPADFVAQWRANRRLFPRGVDLILCAGGDLAALPRTVTIEEA
jgi:alpha-D-ribose 1-methylphosphonate 5-triphosphate synthase subunit PhnH